MLKKLLLTTALLVSTTVIAAVNTPSLYMGPTLKLKTTSAKSHSARELSPGISLGYGGGGAQGTYLAAEIFALPNSIQLENNSGNDATSVKNSYSLGLSVLPGLMVSDATMVFLRLGVLKTRFHSVQKTVLGWQSGIGVQTSLNPSWDLRGEYAYTSYHSISTVGSPVADWFGIGAIYKFS